MKAKQIISILLILMMVGCTTSRIKNYWKRENAPQKKYNKILVMGLIRTSDRSLQQHMENHMIADLADLGYNAVSSLREFGPKAFDEMTEQEALKKLQKTGIDAVITIVLLNKHKEKYYVPGRVYYPSIIDNGRFWDYRRELSGRIHEPGYFVVNTRYFWESNLYEMDDQQLIFSVQTETFNPSSLQRLAHEYGEMIIKSMVSNGTLEQQIK